MFGRTENAIFNIILLGVQFGTTTFDKQRSELAILNDENVSTESKEQFKLLSM